MSNLFVVFFRARVYAIRTGNVRGIVAVRRVARWILGDRGHGRHRVHMLLHGQDTGGVPVRVGPEYGPEGPGPGLIRVYSPRLFRSRVGRPGRQRGPDDRAAHDVHTVRGGVRRPDGGHVPGRHDRHAQLDDDHRRAAHTARVPQALAPRVPAEFLVHHVAHTHKHYHTGLLRAGVAGLGLE